MRNFIHGLSIIALAATSLVFASTAKATLIVEITGVPGSGETIWRFSGQARATGPGFFEDSNNLGDDDTWQNIADFTSKNDLEVTDVSGNATLSINGITRKIDLVYFDSDGSPKLNPDDFGIGVEGNRNFRFKKGDMIRWAGQLRVKGVDINDFKRSAWSKTLIGSQYGRNDDDDDGGREDDDDDGGDPTRIALQIKIRPIPEPATLGLFGLGLAGIGFAVRRRRIA